MEKMYQLVAWTENITDNGKARLYMIPSLESEVQASLIYDLVRIHQEEYRSHDRISQDLAVRAIRAYENISRFEMLTGHLGDAVRYLFFAAKYCIREDDFGGELRHEFVRLCEEGIRLAKKFRREDVLLERTPERMLKLYSGVPIHP